MESSWLMVMMLIAMEISLTTPPFGLLLYVMKGVAPDQIRLTQVYQAALPFVTLELLILLLIVLFPGFALWLPNILK